MGKHKRKTKDKDEELYSLFKKFTKRMRREGSSSSSETGETEAPESAEELQDLCELQTSEPGSSQRPSEACDDPSAVTDTTEIVPVTPSLNEDFLTLLGEDPNKNVYGAPIHKDITSRWNHIVTNGLQKETKIELYKSHPLPDNCQFLEAPKLNLEIKAAISEQVLKRDKAMEQQQNCLGQATACIGKALDILIKTDCVEATKAVSDAGRLLCDKFYNESQSRRYLLQFALNKNTKDIVSQTQVSKHLFGDTLHEQLKTGKAINKTGSEIKYGTQPTKQKKVPLNSRGPPRRYQYQPQHPQSAGRQNYYRPRAPPPPQRRPVHQQRTGPPYKKT